MRVSLFWRTFLFIAPVIAVSVLLTAQFLRVFDRSPPEQQLAWELASVVNLTRTALVNTPSDRRQLLLRELSSEEGVRVFPLEQTDKIESLALSEPTEASLASAVEGRLQTMLGSSTRLAGKVDGESALWISFDIDGDPYWLMMQRERFDRQIGPNWLLIAVMALALAMLGSAAIAQLLNRPLQALAGAIEQTSRGQDPPRLPVNQPTEIAEVNRRFNRLAQALAELESDRTLALAGVSHDIRTPLARLRLQIEMSGLPEADCDSMNEDVERIDQIVGKFLEYGRAGHGAGAARPEDVELALLLDHLQSTYRSQIAGGQLQLSTDLQPREAHWRGDPLDMMRVLVNVIENAMRYGQTGTTGRADVELSIVRERAAVRIVCRDHGRGVPADQLDRLLRPFARLDPERSSPGGAGLGLAIVDRIAQRYDGNVKLTQAPGTGLLITLVLKDDGTG